MTDFGYSNLKSTVGWVTHKIDDLHSIIGIGKRSALEVKCKDDIPFWLSKDCSTYHRHKSICHSMTRDQSPLYLVQKRMIRDKYPTARPCGVCMVVGEDSGNLIFQNWTPIDDEYSTPPSTPKKASKPKIDPIKPPKLHNEDNYKPRKKIDKWNFNKDNPRDSPYKVNWRTGRFHIGNSNCGGDHKNMFGCEKEDALSILIHREYCDEIRSEPKLCRICKENNRRDELIEEVIEKRGL